jgi:hypothetical protein
MLHSFVCVTVKFFLEQDRKEKRGVDVYLYSFFNPALDEEGGQCQYLAALSPEKTRYALNIRTQGRILPYRDSPRTV